MPIWITNLIFISFHTNNNNSQILYSKACKRAAPLTAQNPSTHTAVILVKIPIWLNEGSEIQLFVDHSCLKHQKSQS